ncbi:MAG: hypothetical protein H0U76_24515 [Ktedonobacteraceae bacterium]|nr:hypothetical protein [Ktedonobacteraceae bacterium]
MPRGRKGSPQESVDSILLAISRREDIDVDTMSHHLDRLSEEWAEGAREKVLHLLRSSDGMAQAGALRILAELATDFDLEGLEDFVTDPTVSDLAKLSLAPILKALGSEMADDGIVEYLNDPAGSLRQMQMRLLELVGQNEMGVETILEDVISMPLERRFAFVAWLGNSSDPRAASLLIPLLENQSGKIVFAVIDALEQLGPIAVNQTIPALNHSIASTSNRQLKEHARAILGRLTMQSMLGVEDVAMMEARQQLLPVHEARVSVVDGSGSQLIMLSWSRKDGLIKGINVLYQDQKGIKDCYGVDEMDVAQWDTLVKDLGEQGFSSFHVPFEYARALIMEARMLNRRSRYKVSIAYSIWRPLIEAGIREKKRGQKLPSTLLEPLNLSEEVIALGQRGGEIYQQKEFASWLYEPLERIEPFIAKYWASPALSASQGHAGKSKAEEHQQLLLEQLIDDALEELVDDTWRRLYDARLRRQAALFQMANRKEVMLLRASAALLHPDSPVPLKEQAFARTLMRLSIEQGPLRLMLQSLHNTNAQVPTLDLFDQE